MSRTRYLRPCILAACLALILVTFTGNDAQADESTCITCHTDSNLLADNLAEGTKKKFCHAVRRRLRRKGGSVGAAGKSTGFRGIS